MERSRISKRKKTWQQQLSSRPEGPLLAKGLAGHGAFISSSVKKVFDLLKNKGRGGLARDIQGEQTQQRRQSQSRS